MELFNHGISTDYFSKRLEKAFSEINNISDKEITSCDLQEWNDYLCDKYTVNSISLYEESIEKTISKEVIKKHNPFAGHPYEPDYYSADGIKITYIIPFEGDIDLLRLRPSCFILTKYPCECLEQPSDKKIGKLSLSITFENDTLQEQSDMQKYVSDGFESKFKNYRSMISNLNVETENYNKRLSFELMKQLKMRKGKATSFFAITEALEIPLTINKNAPNVKPLHLQRINKASNSRPKTKAYSPEYCINDFDYQNINNIIKMCGTTMEKTARTYFTNNEEELRDHLLATLNTRYDNATGETFRKIGKTDIHIEFDNKAAYIGECKIWHGKKMFTNAIQQVLSYSTWRDLKVSVIVFNKENKDFNSIINCIDEWVKNCSQSHTREDKNVWNCQYYRSDLNVDVDIAIMLFDLYVDRSQFKDRRY